MENREGKRDNEKGKDKRNKIRKGTKGKGKERRKERKQGRKKKHKKQRKEKTASEKDSLTWLDCILQPGGYKVGGLRPSQGNHV
jgi:hypothetical protein